MLWLVRVEHALYITWGDAKIKLKQPLRYMYYSTLRITNYIIYTIYKQERSFVFMKYSKAKTNCQLQHMVYYLDVSIQFFYDGTNEGIPQKYEIMYGS